MPHAVSKQAHDLRVGATVSYHDQYRSHRDLEPPQNAERKRLVSPQGRRNERQDITISDKIELAHFVVCSGEAKPKISFPFFVGSPPHPPPRKRRKVRKIFGFCSRDRRERTRRAD